MPDGGAASARKPRLAELPSGAPGGTARPILIHPDPRLRETCAPAGDMKFPELRGLVADLFATLYAARGRGLAAPQIGVLRRVFVMDEGWKSGSPAPLAIIEPQITWRSRKTARATEECLSIPGHPVEVKRPAEIRLAFFDLNGTACELDLTGAAARIAQHELDHLNGVLILDAETAPKATPTKTPAARRGRPAARARA